MAVPARFRFGLLVLAAAAMPALFACSRSDEDEPADEEVAGPPANPEKASSLPSAPVSPAAASPSPAPQPALQPGSLPAVLRGRWGLVPADCTSTHGDAKGLMEVGARTLTFYESRATLQSVQTARPDQLRGRFAFSGEGQEWTLEVELRSWNEGAQLIRKDRGPDALPGPLTYTRCGG